MADVAADRADQYMALGGKREQYIAIQSDTAHFPDNYTAILLYRNVGGFLYHKMVGDLSALLYKAWQIRMTAYCWIINPAKELQNG